MNYKEITLSQRPINNIFPVTSPFGVSRKLKLYSNKPKIHKGIDYGSNNIMPIEGEPIYSVMDGIVQMSGWQNKSNHKVGFGRRVWILTETSLFGRLRHVYAHLQSISVFEGEKVKKGDIVGYAGNSGSSTGPHLHFQIEKWPSREPLKPYFYV